MKNELKMVAVLLAVILVIGAASAKPEIKKVKLDINPVDSSLMDVTVGVVTDVGVVDSVVTNSQAMENLNNEEWKKNGLGKGIITIQATNSQGQKTTKLYGSGGCTGNYASHAETYGFANVRPIPNPGATTTFYIDTYIPPYYLISPASIIGICIYPNPGFDRDRGELDIAIALNTTWVPKHSGNHDYFGFGRIHGTDTLALSPARTIEGGTVNYNTLSGSDSSQILMHIKDNVECAKGDNADDEQIDGETNNPETCWRRPGTPPPPGIPEFPTIALPIAAVIGLVFFFQNRKKKEE